MCSVQPVMLFQVMCFYVFYFLNDGNGALKLKNKAIAFLMLFCVLL